jgi:hypothetical protein
LIKLACSSPADAEDKDGGGETYFVFVNIEIQEGLKTCHAGPHQFGHYFFSFANASHQFGVLAGLLAQTIG